MMSKKFGSSIKSKLSLRFGMIISIFMICIVYTFFTLNKCINVNNEINTVYNPSVIELEELKLLVSNSKSYIASWIFVQSDNTNSEKGKLNYLIVNEYPMSKADFAKVTKFWQAQDTLTLDSIYMKIDTLFKDYQKIQTTLPRFESYNMPGAVASVAPLMQEQGKIMVNFNAIMKDLDKLSIKYALQSQKASASLTSRLNTFKEFSVLIALAAIVIGIITTILTIKKLIKPINEVKDALANMGKGEIPQEKLQVGEDELGEMSAALNYLSEGLLSTASYADKIGNGDFNASFVPLSEKDVLGNSLLNMGRKLKVLSEEDKKRNWVTEGLARFADILRANADIKKLSEEVIVNLIKYLGANQGGIFLIRDEKGEKKMDLFASYAYERKKYLQKTIHEGEGLLGQVMLEKDTIYLTEIPNEYIQIRSGMGGDNPGCIVIQPLIVNDELVGAIEIASFKVLDKFEIDFLKKLSENIAGVVANVKINARTVQLLDEARMSQEAMRAQEEELRQNLEELTATQEEMYRKEQEYLQRIEKLEGKS